MSLTNISKNSTTFDSGVDFLLQEISDYILQEDGCKIVLQESEGFKNTSTFTNITKT